MPQKCMLVRWSTPSKRQVVSEVAVWPLEALRVAPLLQHASQPSAGQLQAAAQHQPLRRATPRWECSKVLQLCARLDRVYIIDLVEAPLSVCVMPHMRLAQLVESPAANDDRRRIRKRTTSSRLLRVSFHDLHNVFSVMLTRPISAPLVSTRGAVCDIVYRVTAGAETRPWGGRGAWPCGFSAIGCDVK